MANTAHSWKSTTLSNGIHALTTGLLEHEAVVLLPGWPQTAEAFIPLLPILSPHHHLIVLDPPGLGDTISSPTTCDTASISAILESSIRSTFPERKKYHLVGHDVGAWIAYAWAAQFSSSIKSLTILDSAIPGYGPQLSYPLPEAANIKLWQFSFNALPELPEILTKGKERELLNWLFDQKAVHPERITREARDRYVTCYQREGGMSRGFAYYRAVAKSAEQNRSFAEKEKLKMPVLALGGEKAVGKMLVSMVSPLAVDVKGGEIEDCGHYVMEEQPEAVAGWLLDFFQRVDKESLS
ncbi:related to hydrolases or acyltransferases (alpha/beta hydrolase superfamily) [Phialocephala subalpina]|uniref:Related to hydrolases or acyltransferases (Alpha/beta hydrolase superfamily) n=1 Tax=Phialocephala subalpina TaxID=576137 RepID=A0A1L7WVR6_9HELO|nr:related to hydrolases or acyltransferases (alpha/beta hydrolase superfamily) [Phialocephala subalpina]